jgi:DNA-directed RNA polymerase sigma subunit (sigma70/sigma32)
MSLEEKVSGIDKRLSVVENKTDEHSKLFEKQVEKNDNQVELNTILKMHLEENKENRIQMKKFGDTLDKVNINLTHLNTKQETLDERVTGIESTINESKKSAFKLILSSLKYVGSIAIGIGIAYIYKKLGL